MKTDKMHLINKIFNNETIRTICNKEEEKYYISVVDIEGKFHIIEFLTSKNVEVFCTKQCNFNIKERVVIGE